MARQTKEESNRGQSQSRGQSGQTGQDLGRDQQGRFESGRPDQSRAGREGREGMEPQGRGNIQGRPGAQRGENVAGKGRRGTEEE